MQRGLLDDLFGSPAGGRHRRVRSRGFSLGDLAPPTSLMSMFTPQSPNSGNALMADAPSTPPTDSQAHAEPATPTTHTRRLGSPFHGIAPRPQKVRGSSRHLATASLGHHDAGAFSSIGETLRRGETLDQANVGDNNGNSLS